MKNFKKFLLIVFCNILLVTNLNSKEVPDSFADLVEKLKNEKLENNYLSAPERVKKLAKIHLSQDYIEMDKTNFKYLNEK